jgi:hypothetical protein
LECYVKTAQRDWAPASQIARAVRGQGVQLIDLDRLDEAENVLRRSLELEPESKVAQNKLGYIENLRRQRREEEEQIPWFLHTFVNPPKDPLTVRLLALNRASEIIAHPLPCGRGSVRLPSRDRKGAVD